MSCCLQPFKKILGRRSKSATAIPDGVTSKNKKKDERSNLNKLNPDTLTEISTHAKTTKSEQNHQVNKPVPALVGNLNRDPGSFLSTSDDEEETKKVFNQSWNQLISKNNSQHSQLPNDVQTKMADNKTDAKKINLDRQNVDLKSGIVLSDATNEHTNDSEKSKIIQNLKQEIKSLHSIIHRLNYELTHSSKVKQENPVLYTDVPAPSWLINAKLLSPLIAAYEDRLEERDQKLKNIKNQLNEFNRKLKLLITENLDLHKKIETSNMGNLKVMDTNKCLQPDEWEQVRQQAYLVLEENQLLKEHIQINKQKRIEIEKENARIKSRILFLEVENNDMFTYIENLKNDGHQKKPTTVQDSSTAGKISDYLIRIEELKYDINAINSTYKTEKEALQARLKELETEKTLAENKISIEINQSKRLKAENELIENHLKNIERKQKLSQKKQQLAELKEKIAYKYLNKLTVDFKKIQIENEAYENLIKTQHEENQTYSFKVAAENLKLARMEEKLEQIKLKAKQKLKKSENIKRKKESEYLLNKIEYDKKFQDFLTILRRKDTEIDEILKNKKQLEEDIETIWKLSAVSQSQGYEKDNEDFQR